MADIVSLQPPRRFQDAAGVIAITRSPRPGAFDVRAWLGGPPDHPDSIPMYCGSAPTLAEAARIAREKANALGIREIVDFSSMVDEPGPEGA